MREVLTELMWQTPPAAPDRLRLVYAGQVLTLPADELAQARGRVRARAEANAARRPTRPGPIASTVLLDALWSKVDGAHLDRELFVEEVADRAEFQRFLAGVVARADPDRRCCRGSPTRSGAGPRRRRRPRRWPRRTSSRRDWSVDDVPLLDELAELLGAAAASHRPAPARLPAARAHHRPPAHRHVRAQLRPVRRLEPVRAGASDPDRGRRDRRSTTTRSSPRSAGRTRSSSARGIGW